jgi:hypothetical protein
MEKATYRRERLGTGSSLAGCAKAVLGIRPKVNFVTRLFCDSSISACWRAGWLALVEAYLEDPGSETGKVGV